MRKIAESRMLKRALNVAEMLKTLGFNITFLRSPKYVLEKLSSLNPKDLSMLREAFAENKHPRLMKGFSFHDPHGKSRFYMKVSKRQIWKAHKTDQYMRDVTADKSLPILEKRE